MKTIKKVPVTLQEVVHLPDTLQPNVIYYSEKSCVAVHLCLCGCGQLTVTPIYPDNDPEEMWHITRKDKLTMTPSILQGAGCKSHYIITNGYANFV